MKNFTVNIVMVWPQGIKARVKTKAKARRLDWDKYQKQVYKKSAKKNFKISEDED